MEFIANEKGAKFNNSFITKTLSEDLLIVDLTEVSAIRFIAQNPDNEEAIITFRFKDGGITTHRMFKDEKWGDLLEMFSKLGKCE